MKIEFEKNITEPMRIGDIANFKRGYDLPAYARVEGEYPVMSSSGISGYHNEFKKDGEGLVTGRYGTLGEFYYVNGRYWPHNTALYVTDFKGNYPKYVYFLMKSLSFLKRSDKSTVPGIDRNDLHEFKVPFISGKQQKQIADALFLLEDKIELNNQINTELENLAKTIYNYWFVQFDFPNENGKPYKTSGGEMEWNEELKREIPIGWEVKQIDKVATVKAGGDKPELFSNTKNEVFQIPIYSNGIENEGLYGFTNEAIIKSKSVTVSARGTIGYCVLRNSPFVPIIRLISISPHEEDNSIYFYEFLNSLEFKKNGSVQQQLTVPEISSSNIIMPKQDVLKNFIKITSNYVKKIEQVKEENQELITLRDFLLPMLMNGQVKVKSEAKEQLSMAAEPQVEYGK